MNLLWAVLITATVAGAAIAALLLVRRNASDGGYFNDGDRAAGVFGVIATGFSVLLGLVVFLAFSSYDQARNGAEAEALLTAQQYETAQQLPAPVRTRLSGQLVCYSRAVVHLEWPALDDGGDVVNVPNPWAIAMFRTSATAAPAHPRPRAADRRRRWRAAVRRTRRGAVRHGPSRPAPPVAQIIPNGRCGLPRRPGRFETMDQAIARTIAHDSHIGQRTRFGTPLADHVERVARAVPQQARTVALLHDVLERSSTDVSELVDQGLTPVELAALQLLTREALQSYELYILRIAHAPGLAGALARAVKLADLDDHLSDASSTAIVGLPPYAWARRHIDFARHVRGEGLL